MENKDKKILISLAKSMHKAFCKALTYNEHHMRGKDIVADVVDGNMKPEADPDKVPRGKTGVMVKGDLKKEDIAKKVTEVVMEKYEKHKKEQSLKKR